MNHSLGSSIKVIRINWVKTIVSIIALLVILAHHFLFNLDISTPLLSSANWIRRVFKFDATTITFAVILIIPWMFPFIRPIKMVALWLLQIKHKILFNIIVTVMALSFILINRLWLHF